MRTVIILSEYSALAGFQATRTFLSKGKSMPVFSYLAYPAQGAKKLLHRDLAALEHCEATAAENEELVILVTDTPDDSTEKALQEKLKNLKTLESLSMTFGHRDE